MKTKDFQEARNIIAGISLLIASFFIMRTLYQFSGYVIPGMSYLYNLYGGNIAPNIITVILFDFRNWDTLGEVFILVTAVITTTMVFGWGSLKGYKKSETPEITEESTVLQRFMAFPLTVLLIGFGVTLILGGHISPGGGFPGGAVLATGYFLLVVIYGLKKTPIKFTHRYLVNLSTIGVLIFLLIGVVGLVLSGFYLYNTGVDPYGIVSIDSMGWDTFLSYPDPTTPGIIPYLNLGVSLNVLAGLSLIVLFLMEANKDE